MDFSEIIKITVDALDESANGMFSRNGKALPNPDCIRKLLLSIREIIFPRLSQGEKTPEERLWQVAELLCRECTLCYLATGESKEGADEKGKNATEAFLKTL